MTTEESKELQDFRLAQIRSFMQSISDFATMTKFRLAQLNAAGIILPPDCADFCFGQLADSARLFDTTAQDHPEPVQ